MAIIKSVSFKNKEQDLIDYIGERDFSYYVKNLIRKDKNEKEKVNENPKKIEKAAPKRRNTDFDI